MRIVTTVREGSTKSTLAQHAVAYAKNPKTGVTFLFQVDAASGRLVYVAKQSWTNPVDCDKARGSVSRGRPGRFTATVPLSCLGNPARLTGFSAFTVAKRYNIAIVEWIVLAEDTTRTSQAVLRLR